MWGIYLFAPVLESFDEFIPPRGRKNYRDESDLSPGRNSGNNLDTLFGSRDTFIPNRGKKEGLKRNELYDMLGGNGELFIPNRGKKANPTFGRELFDTDLFYPNRGKKSFTNEDLNQLLTLDSSGSKRNNINSLLRSGDYFVPNRGKKDKVGNLFDEGNVFFPNRGKRDHYERSKRETKMTSAKNTEDIPSKGMKMGKQKVYENRSRRDLLENLAKENADTFFSSRGRRVPSASVYVSTNSIIFMTASQTLLPFQLLDDDKLRQNNHETNAKSAGNANSWNYDDLIDLIKIVHNEFDADNYRHQLQLSDD